jgi:hypothetical protein
MQIMHSFWAYGILMFLYSPAALVAWNNDEIDEEGARLVKPLALGEFFNLQRDYTVLMGQLGTEGEKNQPIFRQGVSA